MSRKQKFRALVMLILALVIVALAVDYFKHTSIPVLEPEGLVGRQEKHLIIEAALISLIVVLPVFAMTIAFAWKYRADKNVSDYRPDWEHNRWLEITWWGIPGIIIFVLSIIAWNSSHSLDPFKSLNSKTQPMSIQVVSLDWKWLFIYPKQHIATVNWIRFPVNTPVNFEITSDSVMNSFWIPALGSQIYSMPGMSTEVNLIADHVGSFRGLSANISGIGFAGMDFTAQAVSSNQFNQWVATTQNTPSQLTSSAYRTLARPSSNNPVTFYSNPVPNLYESIVSKYLSPIQTSAEQAHG